MIAVDPEEERHESYLAEAKRAALDELARGGPEAAVECLIDALKRHPDLRDKGQLLAFILLELRQTLVPRGSGAVRDWVECFTWPKASTVTPPDPMV